MQYLKMRITYAPLMGIVKAVSLLLIKTLKIISKSNDVKTDAMLIRRTMCQIFQIQTPPKIYFSLQKWSKETQKQSRLTLSLLDRR